jgi:putative alpha-1,2-mannosidase
MDFFVLIQVCLGNVATTQWLVRHILDRGYGLDFFAGDEDNGEMGSWAVLSSLGLYSVTPGTTQYVLGRWVVLFRFVLCFFVLKPDCVLCSPIFKHVRIYRPFDKTATSAGQMAYLDIVALGTSEHDYLVDEVLINDVPLDTPTIDDALVQRDGVLRFVMKGEKVLTKYLVVCVRVKRGLI